MSDEHASPDFARMHGWDRDYRSYIQPEVPTYVGPVSFSKRPWVEDAAALMLRAPDVAIVGAPIDEGVSYRPGARFGPRAIRQATYNPGEYSLQLGIAPFEVLDVVDAGDANIVPAWLERGHAMVFRKVLEVTASGAIPDHARRRPLDHLAIGKRSRPGERAAQRRHRPLRRPRRHRE